jgi:glycosyltransferase involved in cell wall biosynthesis
MFSLHVDTSPAWRGAEQQALLLVLGLRSLGHRTALVAHPQGDLFRRANEGPDLIPLATRTDVDLRAAWQLSRVVKRLRPDVVHAHDQHGIAVAAQALSFAASVWRPRLVAARRVDFVLNKNSFSRWKHAQVDCFVAVSERIRQRLVGEGVPGTRVRVVYEGIDLERVAAVPRIDVHAEFWLPHNAPVVGNIAALLPHNGHLHLIESASRVVREVPDARFVIVGDGDLRPAIERQIRDRRLEKHVVLAGSRPDVLALLKSFDIFAMTSVADGLRTAVLEAMACGKPVVAMEADSIAEAVTSGVDGLLVRPRDADALATEIVRVLKDPPLARRIGEAARGRVERQFTVERLVRETLSVYEDLLEDDRAGGGARGRQKPFSGQAASPRGRPNPHAFIIPM